MVSRIRLWYIDGGSSAPRLHTVQAFLTYAHVLLLTAGGLSPRCRRGLAIHHACERRELPCSTECRCGAALDISTRRPPPLGLANIPTGARQEQLGTAGMNMEATGQRAGYSKMHASPNTAHQGRRHISNATGIDRSSPVAFRQRCGTPDRSIDRSSSRRGVVSYIEEPPLSPWQIPIPPFSFGRASR